MKKLSVLSIVFSLMLGVLFSSNFTKAEATSGLFIKPSEGTITSTYGYRWGEIHHGIDIAKSGTVPVVAAAGGTVSKSYYSSSYGNVVFIKHNINGVSWETVYAHLSSRAVSENQSVSKGQFIGNMGNTGNSTGQHLHFELHKPYWTADKSYSVDPYPYISGTTTVADDVVMWNGMELKKGQIGMITIDKPINLWKRNADNSLTMVRVLNPGEKYRVYSYDELHGGQYGVGNGYYVTKMDGYITYQTPSKEMFDSVNNIKSSDEPVYWDGSELKKGQIGRLTILKPINLWKRDANDDLQFVRILNPGEIYRVYNYDNLYGGQYGVGDGHYVTKMDGYVKYETPSPEKLEAAND